MCLNVRSIKSLFCKKKLTQSNISCVFSFAYFEQASLENFLLAANNNNDSYLIPKSSFTQLLFIIHSQSINLVKKKISCNYKEIIKL